jgi:hypothetical protein
LQPENPPTNCHSTLLKSWHAAADALQAADSHTGVTDEIRKLRAAALYKDDKDCKIRQSHNNPEIKAIYKDFLGTPGSEKAEKYLHTAYDELDMYR